MLRHLIVRHLGLLSCGVLLAGCGRGSDRVVGQQSGAPMDTLPVRVRPTPAWPSHYDGIGRRATPAEVDAWNIDVNPTGAGLPPGSGTHGAGARLFAQKCAACHGAHGEGMGSYPRLIGREPRAGFPFGEDARVVKTIGNYWPYSTTLYDYIHRAMPLTAPGSLEPDEIYSVIAYLLAENEIIDRKTVIDARSLPAIRMPARDRFVPDNRTGGATFR